jgi:hypothetical protein
MLNADRRRLLDAVAARPSGVPLRDVRDDVDHALAQHVRELGGPVLDDSPGSLARVRRFLLDQGER